MLYCLPPPSHVALRSHLSVPRCSWWHCADCVGSEPQLAGRALRHAARQFDRAVAGGLPPPRALGNCFAPSCPSPSPFALRPSPLPVVSALPLLHRTYYTHNVFDALSSFSDPCQFNYYYYYYCVYLNAYCLSDAMGALGLISRPDIHYV